MTTPAPDLQQIADNATLHTLVLRMRRSVVELLALNMPHPDFGPIETVVLRVLRHGPRDTDSLRGLTALDMVTFGKTVRKLQRQGLIECRAGRDDKRRRLYELTDEGRAAERLVDDAVIATEQHFLEPLSARDRALMMRLLPKLTLAHAVSGAVPQDARIAEVLEGRLDPGTLLRRTLQISMQFFDQHCGDLKLSPLEAAAIHGLRAFGPIAIKTLPRLLSIDRGSSFAIVARLRALGLIDASSHDQRTLSLSPSGLAFADEVAERNERIEAQFLAVLAKDERPRMMRVMRTLFVRLASSAPTFASTPASTTDSRAERGEPRPHQNGAS